jgi:hypothetical protein
MSFNHTFKYIDDVLSFKSNNFHNYIHLIYGNELDTKDTTESDKSASNRLTTNVMILIMQSSTLFFYVEILSPAYGVYISQLIR